MARVLLLFAGAIRAWWAEFVLLLVLNVLWLLAQLTIVFGPPATAALYAVAGKVTDGDLVGLEDFFRAGRALARRAWIWGAAQWVVYGILGYNLWYYAGASGALALTLRYAWTLLAVVWFTLNLYYWPLNLAQTDTRFTTTLANAGKMALLNPDVTLAYTLLAIVFIVISVLSGALLGAVLGAWLSLWGTLVVRDRLRAKRGRAA